MFSTSFFLIAGLNTSNNSKNTDKKLTSTTTMLSDCSEDLEAQSNKSLLSILDDKNSLIKKLNEQIKNQQMQLSYYFKTKLNPTYIEELSKSCSVETLEESLPLNLAINKFYKENGVKTNLYQMYERMSHLDYKLSRLIKNQEFLLREIINKWFELIENKEKDTSTCNFLSKLPFGNYITQPTLISIFERLLNGTVQLKTNLDNFKISCHHVITIEEERNTIVDQVYSLPSEQRTDVNYLLGIEMEKNELENQIKNINEQQINELNSIEDILYKFQRELKCYYTKSEENCISIMLKNMKYEAKTLLKKTTEKKTLVKEMSTSFNNLEIERIIFYIKVAFRLNSSKIDDETELKKFGIKNIQEIKLLEQIKTEIDSNRMEAKQQNEKEIEKLNEKIEILERELNETNLENKMLKVGYKTLEKNVEQMKLQRRIEQRRLKDE